MWWWCRTDGSGAARKQRRGKRSVNSSAIQFVERLLKVAKHAVDYMESRGSVVR